MKRVRCFALRTGESSLFRPSRPLRFEARIKRANYYTYTYLFRITGQRYSVFGQIH